MKRCTVPKLNPSLPERKDCISRETCIVVADLIAWLNQNKPDALKAAIQAGGQKEVRKALNDLEAQVELWR